MVANCCSTLNAVAGGEKPALPAIKRPEHQRDDDEKQIRSHGAICEQSAHMGSIGV